jgi:hypothetical protein
MAKKFLSVFLSHNRKDKPIARELGLYLASEGVSVWFDEWSINPGHSISASISDGLSKSTHFLLLWSKHAKRSRWVNKEMFSAINLGTRHKPIQVIPICLDKTRLPTLMADLKYIRYKGGTESDRIEIVTAITGKHPSDTYTKAIVRKYNELIDGGGTGLRACPECGSSLLDWIKSSPHCKECGWS